MSEADICEMHWSEVLDYAQGIMIFEGMENSRVTPPMTDKAGSTSFRNSQKDQMKFIWETMFPRSAEYNKEDAERLEAFKGRKEMYRKMQEDINRERGTASG